MNGSVTVSSTAKIPSRRITAALWVLLAASVCLLLLTRLVQQSLFFDGTIYASIARNMAEGVGSEWSPHFSETLFPVFAEHPPLMMWLESLGFMIFGDTIAVEKGFSLLTFLVAGLLLFRMWMRLNNGDIVMQRAAPFALLMALVAGRMKWAFANGMLENLLIVFTSAAVLFVVTAYDERRERSAASRMAWIACAGLATSLALLTKGPVGLFPLVAPALCRLSLRGPSVRMVLFDSVVLFAVIGLFFILLWSFESPREAIQRYLAVQLLPSLSGERGHGGGGWSAFRTFLRVNAYPLLVAALVLAIARKWLGTSVDADLRRRRLRRATFLFLVGCSASLPLFLSPRVSSFYFNPSLVYFSAGLSLLCAPALLEALGRLDQRWQRRLWIGSIVLLAASLVIVGLNFGRPGEDRRTIEEAAKIANIICGSDNCGGTISACGDVAEDWALHAYMQRYYKVSIAKAPAVAPRYMIADDSCQPDPTYVDTGAAIAPRRLLQLGP